MTGLDAWLRAQPGRCPSCGFDTATQGCRCRNSEWSVFVSALRQAAEPDGTIHQHRVRPLIQSIPHKHRGQLYRKARLAGVVEIVGKEPSKDHAGRNTDKESRVYRLRKEAA